MLLEKKFWLPEEELIPLRILPAETLEMVLPETVPAALKLNDTVSILHRPLPHVILLNVLLVTVFTGPEEEVPSLQFQAFSAVVPVRVTFEKLLLLFVSVPVVEVPLAK